MLSFPQGITLVHYIDDVVLIGPNEQEVTTILDLLTRHLFIRGQEIQAPSTIMKFLEVQ